MIVDGGEVVWSFSCDIVYVFLVMKGKGGESRIERIDKMVLRSQFRKPEYVQEEWMRSEKTATSRCLNTYIQVTAHLQPSGQYQ